MIESFAGKVLQKKLKFFEIPTEIDDDTIDMLAYLSQGNPGMIQVAFLDVLGKKTDKSTMTLNDVIKYAKTSELERLWDEQKERGQNKVDTKAYWMSFYPKNEATL